MEIRKLLLHVIFTVVICTIISFCGHNATTWQYWVVLFLIQCVYFNATIN